MQYRVHWDYALLHRQGRENKQLDQVSEENDTQKKSRRKCKITFKDMFRKVVYITMVQLAHNSPNKHEQVSANEGILRGHV